MMYYDSSWFLYVLPAVLLASFAQAKVMRAYNKYSKVSSETGYTGRDVARMILDRNGLDHVQIEMTSGKLTDHYDPRTKVIRLSRDIYAGTSVASMSIAAHEVGHAIQDATGYTPLKIRSAIAPIASLSSRLVWVFIMLGFLFSPILIEVGIAMFAAALIFQVVTLPVEFNASNRALDQLEQGIAPASKINQSKEVLSAAALTYVAATVVALGELLRLLAITSNQRERR